MMALLLLLWPLSSGAADNFLVRPLSLKDCIQMALEHNLDVKIERFTPEIAGYDLNLAYAYYEPVFGGSGVHRFDFETPEQTPLLVWEPQRGVMSSVRESRVRFPRVCLTSWAETFRTRALAIF
jgi:hypothetical protein